MSKGGGLPLRAPVQPGMPPPAPAGSSDEFTSTFTEPGTLGLLFTESSDVFMVQALAAKGLALSDPRIMPGAVVVAVQGEPISGLRYEQRIARLREAGRPLCITFRRSPAACCPQEPPALAAARAGGLLTTNLSAVRDLVLALLGAAGASLGTRPATIGEMQPGTSVLFREHRPLPKRRYSGGAHAADRWRVYGGTGITRLRLSPADAGRGVAASQIGGDSEDQLPLELVRRSGKVARAGGLSALTFHEYEIRECGVKKNHWDAGCLLYHVAAPGERPLDARSAAKASKRAKVARRPDVRAIDSMAPGFGTPESDSSNSSLSSASGYSSSGVASSPGDSLAMVTGSSDWETFASSEDEMLLGIQMDPQQQRPPPPPLLLQEEEEVAEAGAEEPWLSGPLKR